MCFICVMMLICGVSCTEVNHNSHNDETTLHVNFYAGEMFSIVPIKVKKGEKITKPEDPIKPFTETEESEFEGWYDGEKLWDFDVDVVSQDITLIAKWKTKTYTGDLPIRR